MIARTAPFSCALVWVALAACGGPAEFDPGTLSPDQVRPELASTETHVERYEGDNVIVLSAQEDLFDGFALQANVISPTCGPINNVCHNAKEYPDLHTPANFLSAIGAPCNVQPGSYQAVYDRCEPKGDRLALGHDQPELEVAYIEYVAGSAEEDDEATADAASPGLHIYLAGSVDLDDREFWSDARFMRSFIDEDGSVQELPFFTFQSRYRIVADDPYRYGDGERGTHVVAQVRDYQTGQVDELLSVGIREADKNRNGILGARRDGNPISLIAPGNPEESYLVGRMRGAMTGDRIPGSRMPLANEPLDSVEMLALFCFIEGLSDRQQPVDLATPIDYSSCSYSQRPEELELLGSGVSWDGRIRRILDINCGGCHGGEAPAADLDLKDGDVHARLLEASSQRPELKLVEPGQPDMSYLLHKLEDDPSILGAAMPVDPLDPERRLMPRELADMRAWIEEGALPGGEAEVEAETEAEQGADDAGMPADAGF